MTQVTLQREQTWLGLYSKQNGGNRPNDGDENLTLRSEIQWKSSATLAHDDVTINHSTTLL